MKMLGLVVAVAALILAGFLVVPSLHSVGRSGHPAASSTSTSSMSTPSTTSAAALAPTLACTLTFGPGASQPDSPLVGMSLAAAEAQVSAASQVSRIVGQDGRCADVTADGVFRRVDLWVVNGIVVQAVLEQPPSSG
jgi:tetrahydromethanopterin S-methyltransferase subunit D